MERFPLRKKTLPLVYQLPLTVPDMASRKNLKKEIGYVIGELFTECMIYTELVPGADKKASDEILIDLMNIENEFIKRINHTNQQCQGLLPQIVQRLRREYCQGA